MNQHRNMKARIPKGTSLIEMLLVMSLMSVIFTVGITTLAFLMRVEMKGTARIQDTLNLQKLSHQFREDVGVAQNAVILPQGNSTSSKLKLESENGTSIIYSGSNEGNSILWEKKHSDKTIARNEFRVPQDVLQFEIEKINQRLLVSMLFRLLPEETHENQTVTKPSKSFKVVSLLNQKHAFQNRSE